MSDTTLNLRASALYEATRIRADNGEGADLGEVLIYEHPHNDRPGSQIVVRITGHDGKTRALVGVELEPKEEA